MILSRSKFHFIGIGGIGMSGLAELLNNMGATITGSDASENENVQKLKSQGIEVFKGHNKENLGEVDVVVFSSAIQPSNPELLEAKFKKIPVISRAEVLGEVMRLKRGIAVAGSHGKTTTTSLTASIFLNAQMDPTVVVGGRLDLIKSNAFLGKGEWLIAEADESDGSFKRLSPEIAIITNIDDDHMDFYKTYENLQKAFLEFAGLVPFYGFIVIMGDDIRNRNIFENFDKRVLFYGFHESNDFFLRKEMSGKEMSGKEVFGKEVSGNDSFGKNAPRGEGTSYSIFYLGEKLGTFQLKIPGEHNALNALAAFIVAYKSGIDANKCIEGLHKFAGVDRRFQRLGEKNGIEVYDDYGHHPTEVKAVLKAFKEKYPTKKIVVAFQPHRYSRTQMCWADFLNSFHDCDELKLVDVYAASEAPIEGISSEKMALEMKHKNCEYIGPVENILNVLNTLKPGTVFVTLGAGDIYKYAKKFLGIT